MTKIERRLVSRYNFENDSVHSGQKDMGRALTETLPQATQRISLDKVYYRTGFAGTVNYFDTVISEITGGRVLIRHRFKSSAWVAGQRLYGRLYFPGGLVGAAGTALRIFQDTIDTGGICHTEQGHVEVAA